MKILIIHPNPAEAEKLQKALASGGYDAVTGQADCPDADMVLAPREPVFVFESLSIDFPARCVIANGQKVHLTPIEFNIVAFLAKNQGIVFTHEQIINEIWGPQNSDSVVLRVNIANIRRKIEPTPAAPKYILTEAGIGYYMNKQIFF